jgi:small subunit ribosomal protein S15
MAIEPGKKKEIIGEFKRHEKDTGSAEVQIAILTHRINRLTEHFEVHKKDYSSKRGLLKLIARRRKLLNYLKKTDKERYFQILKKLNLRK